MLFLSIITHVVNQAMNINWTTSVLQKQDQTGKFLMRFLLYHSDAKKMAEQSIISSVAYLSEKN